MIHREKLIEKHNRVRGRALYELRKKTLNKEEVMTHWKMLSDADKEIEIQKAYLEKENG